MQPTLSVQNAVIHRAAILQRASVAPAPLARPAAPAHPSQRTRDQEERWDRCLIVALIGCLVAFGVCALLHLA